MNRKVVKGKLGDIVFQFNPTEMEYGGGANWTTISSPAMGDPYSQYASGKPTTYSFELWVNERAFREGNAERTLKLLDAYRKGKTPIVFVYAGFAERVIIQECNIVIKAMSKTLKPIELLAQITLQKF